MYANLFYEYITIHMYMYIYMYIYIHWIQMYVYCCCWVLRNGGMRLTAPAGSWPLHRESLLDLWRRTANWRRPERARNEKKTGPKGLWRYTILTSAPHTLGRVLATATLRGGYGLLERSHFPCWHEEVFVDQYRSLPPLHLYLTQPVFKVIWQESTSPQIRQLILYYYWYIE